MSSGTTSWHVVNRCKDDFKEFVDTLVVALRIIEKADCSPPQMSFYRGNASPDTPRSPLQIKKASSSWLIGRW